MTILIISMSQIKYSSQIIFGTFWNFLEPIFNPGTPTQSDESLRDLLAYDWFHGPNGGNNVNFNGWGEYTGTSGTAGDARIYGLPTNASNINYKMSDPAGEEYYYETQSPATDRIEFDCYNNLSNPADNVMINTYFGNPFGNFSYASFGGPCPAGGGGPVQPTNFKMSNIFSPFINNGYWYLTLSTDPPFNGSSASGFTIQVNGTTYVTATLPPGMATYNWAWNTGGASNFSQVSSYSSSTGNYTGQYIRVDLN